MRGLLLKDFYNMSGQFKVYAVFPIFAGIMAYVQGSYEMLQFLLGALIMIVPLSAFAYDEMCNFNTYAMTLPIRRFDLVLSRYVLSALIALLVGVISIVVVCLLQLIIEPIHFENFSLRSFIIEEMFVIFALYALNCVLLPLLFKFGSEKARIVLCLIIASVGAIFLFLNNLLGQFTLDMFSGNLILCFIAGLLIVIQILSLWISNCIMNKKEF